MSPEMGAVIVFGLMAAFAIVMLVMERRAAARRLKDRGGREVDISSLIFFGSKAGKGKVTNK